MAAALQATAGYDPYDPRSTRDVPPSMDVLGRLADGIAGLAGVLQEGFDEAEGAVRDLVMAAVDVLPKRVPTSPRCRSPHHTIRTAQAALSGEGALALFNTGFFGAFTRTYYPPPSSPPSTSCGPPTPMCSRHAASCRSSPLS